MSQAKMQVSLPYIWVPSIFHSNRYWVGFEGQLCYPHPVNGCVAVLTEEPYYIETDHHYCAYVVGVHLPNGTKWRASLQGSNASKLYVQAVRTVIDYQFSTRDCLDMLRSAHSLVVHSNNATITWTQEITNQATPLDITVNLGPFLRPIVIRQINPASMKLLFDLMNKRRHVKFAALTDLEVQALLSVFVSMSGAGPSYIDSSGLQVPHLFAGICKLETKFYLNTTKANRMNAGEVKECLARLGYFEHPGTHLFPPVMRAWDANIGGETFLRSPIMHNTLSMVHGASHPANKSPFWGKVEAIVPPSVVASPSNAAAPSAPSSSSPSEAKSSSSSSDDPLQLATISLSVPASLRVPKPDAKKMSMVCYVGMKPGANSEIRHQYRRDGDPHNFTSDMEVVKVGPVDAYEVEDRCLVSFHSSKKVHESKDCACTLYTPAIRQGGYNVSIFTQNSRALHRAHRPKPDSVGLPALVADVIEKLLKKHATPVLPPVAPRPSGIGHPIQVVFVKLLRDRDGHILPLGNPVYVVPASDRTRVELSAVTDIGALAISEEAELVVEYRQSREMSACEPIIHLALNQVERRRINDNFHAVIAGEAALRDLWETRVTIRKSDSTRVNVPWSKVLEEAKDVKLITIPKIDRHSQAFDLALSAEMIDEVATVLARPTAPVINELSDKFKRVFADFFYAWHTNEAPSDLSRGPKIFNVGFTLMYDEAAIAELSSPSPPSPPSLPPVPEPTAVRLYSAGRVLKTSKEARELFAYVADIPRPTFEGFEVCRFHQFDAWTIPGSSSLVGYGAHPNIKPPLMFKTTFTPMPDRHGVYRATEGKVVVPSEIPQIQRPFFFSASFHMTGFAAEAHYKNHTEGAAGPSSSSSSSAAAAVSPPSPSTGPPLQSFVTPISILEVKEEETKKRKESDGTNDKKSKKTKLDKLAELAAGAAPVEEEGAETDDIRYLGTVQRKKK